MTKLKNKRRGDSKRMAKNHGAKHLAKLAAKASGLKAVAAGVDHDVAKQIMVGIDELRARVTALEQHVAAKGERGEKGEKGSGFWG